MVPTKNPIGLGITTKRSRVPILPTSSLTKTPPRQRLRFDNYDHFREIPTRKALTECGYYDFLNEQDLQSPLSKDEKRKVLVSTAEKNQTNSTAWKTVPAVNETPEKSIFEKTLS